MLFVNLYYNPLFSKRQYHHKKNIKSRSTSHRFLIIVFWLPFFSKFFLISCLIYLVIYWLFSNILIGLYLFVFFCSFILVIDFWSYNIVIGNTLDIPVFLNLLRLELRPKMWPILENVPCASDALFYTYHLNMSGLIYRLRAVLLCCFSVWMKYPLM